ncbi:hypothetical protein, partial [Sphingobium xenophagum]|uniref:hypothetical protein n=1 Tax=Sphingobium xenophagum TaxID=121428 RepID=UPI001CB6F55D
SFRPSNLRQACSSFTIFATEPNLVSHLFPDAVIVFGLPHPSCHATDLNVARDGASVCSEVPLGQITDESIAT